MGQVGTTESKVAKLK
jgi:transposase